MKWLTGRTLGAIVLALSATILAIAIPVSVFAIHKVYLQEDPLVQAHGQGYPYNAVNIPWAWGSGATGWDYTGDLAEATTAVQDWQTAVPQLTFTRTFQGSASDLFIKPGTCEGAPGAPACFIDSMRLANNPRQADYLQKGVIEVVLTGISWTPTGKRAVLQHEIGHWIGIHERYLEPNTCSDNLSVMNAVFPSSGNCQPSVTVPTAWDKATAEGYWIGGNVQDATLAQTSYLLLDLNWKDAMWAEAWHYRDLWSWNWTTSRWDPRDGALSDQKLGFHRQSLDRTMNASWYLPNYGWPTGTYYIAGVSGYNWRTQQWTLKVWTGQVYVP
jgi:hypothetical protein